jgi:hypothetical protein
VSRPPGKALTLLVQSSAAAKASLDGYDLISFKKRRMNLVCLTVLSFYDGRIFVKQINDNSTQILRTVRFHDRRYGGAFYLQITTVCRVSIEATNAPAYPARPSGIGERSENHE